MWGGCPSSNIPGLLGTQKNFRGRNSMNWAHLVWVRAFWVRAFWVQAFWVQAGDRRPSRPTQVSCLPS